MTQPTITALRAQVAKTTETIDKAKAVTQEHADEAAARAAESAAQGTTKE